MTTVQHRALNLPEIVAGILEHVSDNSSLFACAQGKDFMDDRSYSSLVDV